MPAEPKPDETQAARDIAVVTPVFGGAFSIAYDAATALSNLGHRVTFLDMRIFADAHRIARTAGTPAAQQHFFSLTAEHILRHVLAARCEILFALALAPVRAPLLQRLKAHGVTTAMWHVEQHERFDTWRHSAHHYDFFFRIQEAPFATLLDAAAVPHHSYLPVAASSAPQPEHTQARPQASHCPLVFFGSPYENRFALLQSVADRGLSLWGQGWSDVPEPLASCVRSGDTYLDGETEAQVYKRADIVLNPHSVGAQETTRDFLNPRLFTLAARGHFQLTDARSLLRRHFTADEVIAYESTADLQNKVDYFLAHPEARQRIATAAQRRALRDHTYEHRMTTMLEHIAEQGSARPDATDTPGADLSPRSH